MFTAPDAWGIMSLRAASTLVLARTIPHSWCLSDVTSFAQGGTHECVYTYIAVHTYIGVTVYVCAYTCYYVNEIGLNASL